MFNQQQFDRLAKEVELHVLVAVPWPNAIRNWRAYRRARREGAPSWPYADYFIYWYLPGFGRSLHVPFFLLSVLMQRFSTVLLQKWDCMLGSWAYPDAIATALLGWLTHTPVIAKVHGSDINVYADMPTRRWQIRGGLNLCDSVVAVSQPLAARLESLGVDRRRIHTVFNGVDLKLFHPRSKHEARLALGISDTAKVILFIGNLLKTKGCHDLFDAFAPLAHTDPELQLVFVGAGAAKSHVERRAAEEGLERRVRFTGKVRHDALPPWFAACDLFCLPSHNEGVPNVILEAMASGVPVVASRVGGIPDALPTFAGTLVRAHDIGALTSALGAALEHHWDFSSIAAHADNFDWDTNIQQMISIISGATDEVQPPRNP
jgi:glycosyltransferase involved in cell wall biosynthesis